MEAELVENEEKPKNAPPPKRVIEFWRETGEAWISTSLSQLDERAKWMVTIAAGITVADSALIKFLENITVVSITPSLFFSFATLFFIVSLFPKKYNINPNMTTKMRETYAEILDHKLKWHRIGFGLFFIGLIFTGIATLY